MVSRCPKDTGLEWGLSGAFNMGMNADLGRIDWEAVTLSLRLATVTLACLIPAALVIGRALALSRSRAKPWFEALLALPLVLPPTVVGYYLLVALGVNSPLGRLMESLIGHTLAFSFTGLVLASILVNLPFAVIPLQRAFESIAPEIREAAQCCGMTVWQALRRIELPLIWPGLLSAMALTFTHTLGEFGVVLMVGGNIPGETRTVAIAIYDRAQAFDQASAGAMALMLVALSIVTVVLAHAWLAPRQTSHRDARTVAPQ